MSFKAAIFDLDGTLVDSLEDLADSANLTAQEFGHRTHELSRFRFFVGNGAKKLIERSFPSGTSGEEIEKALVRFREIYAEHYVTKTRPYDGITSALSELKVRGLKLAVCTNKPQEAAAFILEKFFGANFFADIIGDKRDGKIKPDPTHVLEMVCRLGVKPKDVAYFGDSCVDMQTAHNAGFFAVGVTWGFRPRKELEEYGADLLIDAPKEILRIAP